jgi:virginiamycin B lyase
MQRIAMVGVIIAAALRGIGAAQTITEFSIPTAASGPMGIALGADGNIWFIESAANKIGRITSTGVITEFPIPTASSGPFAIASGPDGALWFTEIAASQIGQITVAGAIREFPIPFPLFSAAPRGIAMGWDGNLWFTAGGGPLGYRIEKINTQGSIQGLFPLLGNMENPLSIVRGPDGNM